MPRISRLILTLAFSLVAASFASARADDWLDQASKSMRESEAKLHSLVGEAVYEVTQRKVGSKDVLVTASARMKIYFDNGKYRLQIKYSKPWIEAQQKLGMRLTIAAKQAGNGNVLPEVINSNWDEFHVVYNGSAAYEIAFANGVDDPSCTAFIYPNIAAALGRHGLGLSSIDPARISRSKFDIDDVTKGISDGRYSIDGKVKNADGSRTQTYRRKVPTKHRIEYDMMPSLGYRITEFRAFTDSSQEPVNRQTLQWNEIDGELFVTKFTYERPSFSTERFSFDYLSFEPNRDIDPKLFTVEGIGVPDGFEFTDMRPISGTKSLYKFKNGMTPVIPHALIFGYLNEGRVLLITGRYLETANIDGFTDLLHKRAEIGLELICDVCALSEEQKQEFNAVFALQNSILLSGVKKLANEINSGRITQDPDSLEHRQRINELGRQMQMPFLATDQIGGKIAATQLSDIQKQRLHQFVLARFMDTITPYLELRLEERNSLFELLRERTKSGTQYVFDPQIYFDLLGNVDPMQIENILGDERMGFFRIARGSLPEFISTKTPITVKSFIARLKAADIELERQNIKP